jgi:hypothetical protein
MTSMDMDTDITVANANDTQQIERVSEKLVIVWVGTVGTTTSST